MSVRDLRWILHSFQRTAVHSDARTRNFYAFRPEYRARSQALQVAKFELSLNFIFSSNDWSPVFRTTNNRGNNRW